MTKGYDFPVIVGLDSIDANGTMRIGPGLFGPFYSGTPSGVNPTARYSSVATLLLATVQRLCVSPSPVCDAYTAVLTNQRLMHATQSWSDAATGRMPLT